MQKWNTQKIFAFGKGLQTTDIDRHSTYIKKMQKSPKNWENVGAWTSYSYLTHARKKVIFFLHRKVWKWPTSPYIISFSSPGGKKLLPHETETSTIIVVCQSSSSTSFLFYFCWFCLVPKSDRHRPSQKKGKKARKTGKWQSVTLIYSLYAREEKSKIFLYIEGMEMTVTDCH